MSLFADIRYALRTLTKHRAFTVTAVATLAIGIAVNTIVFTLVNAVLLRPLPVPDARRVVRIRPLDVKGKPENLFSFPDFLDYREQAQRFDAIGAYVPTEITIGRSSLDRDVVEPRFAVAYVVSPEYFTITGMRPAVGRLLQAADEREVASHAVVLGHAFWVTRFAGDPRVLGSTLMLNGRPFTVVGVGPRDFAGTEPLVADVWVSLAAEPVMDPVASAGFADRSDGRLLMLGRMSPGVTLASAEESLNVIARRLAAGYPSPDRSNAVTVATGTFFSIDPGLKSIIALVMAIVGLLLLIACSNVANLTLARASSRQREIAVRLAIGASRQRIVRELLTETIIVGVVSGAVALLLSVWTLRVLYTLGVSLASFPWTIDLNLTPDWRVFGYTFALALGAGILFGIVPALQISARRISGALHEDGAVLGTRVSRSRVRSGLVVTQIAGSLVLLIAAALLTRGLQKAQALDLGFSPQNVLYLGYDLIKAGYSPERAARFEDELRARASRLPDVRVVALTSHVPLHGGIRRSDARLGTSGGARSVNVIYTTVSPDYFDALRIPIIAGRVFNDDDRSGRSSGVIVSEGLAARFWPNENPLGRTFLLGHTSTPMAVVGLARDSSSGAIWREKELTVYLPVSPSTDVRSLQLLVRTEGDSANTAIAMHRIASTLDPDVRFDVSPLESLLRLWILPSRVAAAAAAILGLLALTLASIGIYGVLAYLVSQRTREIGVRMALGADPRRVLRLVMGDGARLVAVGLVIGAAVAAAGAPFLRALLFGVSRFDPAAFAAGLMAMTVVALAACYVPARRAARVEPLIALRTE